MSHHIVIVLGCKRGGNRACSVMAMAEGGPGTLGPATWLVIVVVSGVSIGGAHSPANPSNDKCGYVAEKIFKYLETNTIKKLEAARAQEQQASAHFRTGPLPSLQV